MRKWTKLVSILLALCMLAGFPAYGAVIGPGVSPSAVSSVEEPEIQSEGAVVIDAASGNILYGKNENTKFYPASITKLMTAMLVLERANLSDIVTFSESATSNLESGAVTLNLTAGDELTVEQCLYALLLKSANEVGNALAEHVAGSVAAFADLMNQKAASLGCTNTHFVNPHGLNDVNHYTTPYDMALIARAAFQNPTLCKIDTTTSYQLPATKLSAARTITMGHKMMYATDSRYYEGIIGGKTGYTSKAGNTLVTGVERNGVRLIAVVMKSSNTHYADTKALLDYGFEVMKSKASAGPDGNSAASGQQNTDQQNANQQITNQQTASAGPDASLNGSSETSAAGTAAGEHETGSSGSETSGSESSGSQAGVLSPQASQSTTPGWKKDDTGWYYIKENGSRAAGEWLYLENVYYWIDTNGYMATGWRHFTNGEWYYFRSSGAMAENYWAPDNGKWFYLGTGGAMLTNTTTPDGYKVDADGVWVQ